MGDLVLTLEHRYSDGQEDVAAAVVEMNHPDDMNIVPQFPVPVNPNMNNNVRLLNEASQKGNFAVAYVSESAGEQHAPLWTVRVRG